MKMGMGIWDKNSEEFSESLYFRYSFSSLSFSLSRERRSGVEHDVEQEERKGSGGGSSVLGKDA